MATPLRITNLVTGEVFEYADANRAASATPFKRQNIVQAARGLCHLPGYRVEKLLKKRRVKKPMTLKKGLVSIRIADDLFALVSEQAAREGMTKSKAFRLLLEKAIKEHFVQDGVFVHQPVLPDGVTSTASYAIPGVTAQVVED